MAKTVIACLDSLFCFFGFPYYLHSDRGSSFLSHEIKEYLLYRGIASSHSSLYHPTGNSQCKRVNQTIWRTIKLILHGRSLPEELWEDVLQEGLHCIRSLVCLATNETPHERMFKFQRKAMTGISMPTRLLTPGTILLRRFIRHKSDPQCKQVKLLDANPTYAHVILLDGCKSTVSTSDLATWPGTENERQKVSGDVNPLTEPTDSSADLLIHKHCDLSTGHFDAETLTDTEQLTKITQKQV